MKYIDFVDLKYDPLPNDVICDFHLEPSEIDLREAAGGVAAESSIGTWTELTTMRRYIKRLHARVFSIEGGGVRIAYPSQLFEPGNMANILSSVAGNVFGLRALKNVRLNNIQLPRKLISSFKGPKYGITGVRRILNVKNRPLVGTIIKPKLGLRTQDHARIAYESWSGGCDIVKDDENLSSQTFNPFKDRIIKTLKSRDKAEAKTGERKVYMANVTAETNEMIKRAKFVKQHGGEYIMIDILTCGFSALQTLRDCELNLVLHAHRAGHAAFTKNRRHGINMRVIAKLSRIIGVDQLHVGTVVGKMYETKREVIENCLALREELFGIKPALPVASGGLHPKLIPSLFRIFGVDFIIQAGGGIHGHKRGPFSGARAMRQALDATINDIPLNEYATTHKELDESLRSWTE